MEKAPIAVFPTNTQKSQRERKLCLAVVLFYRYRRKQSLPKRPFNLKDTEKRKI